MKKRIIVIYVILAVIVSSLVSFISYRYSSQIYINQIENELKHEAILISRIIMHKDIKNVSDAYAKELTNDLKNGDNDDNIQSIRRITIIKTDGVVIADSNADSTSMVNHKDRPEIAEAIINGTGSNIRMSDTTMIKLLYLAYYSKEADVIVRVSTSVDYINNIRNSVILYTILAVIAAIIIASPLIFKLSDYAIKPLSKLVKQYTRSQETDRTNTQNKDEVGQLSSTLSSMAKYLENVINELEDRNARVNTIINSMDNGLIAVDQSMHVIMINPVANRKFGGNARTTQIGAPLVQVIRHRQINELLNKAIETNKVLTDEIQLYQSGKRILAIHVSPICPMNNKDENSGALAFINDVTQVRKLEEMRSEFVANVTHELKTPLTSIQGFVETLKAGAIDDKKVAEKFLDIIEIEADRLRTLINDILELSEIESMKHEKEKQRFFLLPLVEEVKSMLSNAANDKKVTIDVEIPQDISINANRNRIKQLLINLIDNAVKYNKTEGRVSVFAEAIGNQLEIHVKDNGIGVSENQTARIFERFYRVDKGRSREMGGTGLGLSIVKHIAQLYGGSVRVTSIEGKGSDFIITLPI